MDYRAAFDGYRCRRWLQYSLLPLTVSCDARAGLDDMHRDAVGRFEPPALRDAGAPVSSIPCTRVEVPDPDAGAAAAPGGKLTVTFTPAPPPGAMKGLGAVTTTQNCGVVWIEEQNGALVKTLDFWGGAICFSSLVDYTGRFVSGCPIDVVTRPTMHAYTPLSLSWDGESLHGEVLQDGDYTLAIDVQIDDLHPIPTFKIPFTKGRTPFVLRPAPMSPQSDLTLTYTPE